mgnify:CR=1 FL=1
MTFIITGVSTVMTVGTKAAAMSRSTLKLPAKTVADVAAGGGSGRSRRPIRGQGAVVRQAGRRRSDGDAPPAAASQPLPRPGAVAAAPRRPAAAKPEWPDAGRDVAVAGKAPEARPSQPGAGRGSGAAPQSGRDARGPSGSAQGVDAAGGGRSAGPQPGAPRKQHPPRGVARSTGARACPPSRPATGATTASEGVAEPGSKLAERAAEQPANQSAAASGRPGMAKEPPRLSRLVSELTGCSRREADEWIENGWVSVDGVVISRLGARVSPKATIEIRDAARKHRSASVSILFHKPPPAGDAPEPVGRETAAGRIRADNRWVEDDPAQRFVLAHLRGLAPAGALDASAGGMLVFTQEGSVARRLAGGDARLEKEYHVLVEGVLAADGLERLRHGLVLDGIRLRPADVSWLAGNRLRIVVRQSLPRQIPRMCALLGLRVRELRCVRIGSVSLGRLPPGAWRYLRADERF